MRRRRNGPGGRGGARRVVLKPPVDAIQTPERSGVPLRAPPGNLTSRSWRGFPGGARKGTPLRSGPQFGDDRSMSSVVRYASGMPNTLPFADVAALIGEPSRATILGVLLSGGAYTASELAARAGIAPSTASRHLHKLREGGLVSRASQGRYRFFRLASPEVARTLEALGTLAAIPAH